MTATRDRRAELDEERAEPAWDERPLFGRSRGLPWWGAVLLAVGLSAVGAVIDMKANDTLGTIFQVAFVAGCVAAVCLVRRRNLFGPVVQPPLVFALVSVGANVALGAGASGGLKGLVFNVALPLTSNFPTMAITTGVVLAIGVARLFLQKDPDPRKRVKAAAKSRPAADEADDAPPPRRRPKPADPARKPERARPREDSGRPRRPAREDRDDERGQRRRPRPER
ncbi:DUF6542 domain-containing protein [Actinokineospora guangxiensis]|uniref:DUF6542 domain-containing protein n=1 Tax=Actinokineospora guangxiensis TaxID=1490288 RepID=A0ABW0EMM7_9PSEU